MSVAPHTRQVEVDLGIHGIFLNRRWEEPDNMFAAVRGLGLRLLQFGADLLDPFFVGDASYQRERAAAFRAAAARHEVEIVQLYTGQTTRAFHGLAHSAPAVRNRMWVWIERAMELAVELGVAKFGGHWHTFPSEVVQDEKRRAQAEEQMVEDLGRLQELCDRKGLAEVCLEQMYTPAEPPWTIAEARALLRRLNADGRAPLRLGLDTGHVASVGYGGAGEDRDYAAWARQLGAVCEFIHVHQTTATSSSHWPFTPERNALGHIDVGRLLEALADCQRLFEAGSFGAGLTPVERHVLVLEIFPATVQSDDEVLHDLRQSVAHLRRYVPESGLRLAGRP